MKKAARAAILEVLDKREPGKTICPSEAARRMAEDWRPLMPLVREAAAQLARDGLVEVTQKGLAVDALQAKGPIRLRALRSHGQGTR